MGRQNKVIINLITLLFDPGLYISKCGGGGGLKMLCFVSNMFYPENLSKFVVSEKSSINSKKIVKLG